MKVFRFQDIGRVAYEDGLAAQCALHADVVAGGTPALLSLEHDPVYTLGRRDVPNQFVGDAGGIPVVKTDRGGEITYHGPGQAVVYVIFPLTRLRLTLPALVGHIEQAIIDVAASFGITAAGKQGWRGVFAGDEKLASIGLAVHHDVTMHGLAVNVCNDLGPFSRIHPCGLPIRMCSFESLGKAHPGRAGVGWMTGDFLAGRLGAGLDVKFAP